MLAETCTSKIDKCGKKLKLGSLRSTCTRNKFRYSYMKPMADNKETQNFLILNRTKLQSKVQRMLQTLPNPMDRKQKESHK